MSIKYMDMVFSCEHITDRGELCVLLALADWCDDDGKCYPSIPQLAKKSRLSDRGVRKVLGRVKGVYVDWNDNDGGRGARNQYRLITKSLKGEPRSGFSAPERVNPVQGLGNLNGEPGSGFSESERVNPVQGLGAQKGEPRSGFRDEKPGTGVHENPEPGSGAINRQYKPSINTPPLPPPPDPSIADRNQNGRGGGGVFDGGFLTGKDESFRSLVVEALAAHPERDPVALVKAQLEWKTCRKTTQKQLHAIADQYGFEIYAASVVMAAAEVSLKNPLPFLRSVCERLDGQRIENERRRRMAKQTRKAPAPDPEQSGRTPAEILGGSITDEKTWQVHR